MKNFSLPFARAPDSGDQIAAEKIRLASRHTPGAISITAVLGLLVLILFQDHVPPLMLWGWLTIVFLSMAIRALVWDAYRRGRSAAHEAREWGRRFTFAMGFSGVAWGSAPWLLFGTDAVVEEMAVSVMIAGLAAGAMATSATYLPLFYAFLFPILVPLAVFFFAQATVLDVTMGIMATIYLVTLATFGRQNYQGFTELIDLRYEIGVQRDKAEQASIAKSKFFAAASHDLRQPLHALSLLAGTLDRHVHDSAESHMVLDRIHRSVSDLENLFNALLDVSKLDAQVIRPQIEDFPLQRVVENLELDWIQIARDKGLQWERDGNFESVIVRSDPMLLKRIIRNLISNAVKYTNTGKVSIGVLRKDSGAEIYVSDTGPGIPKDKHQEIFREFYQLHNPERNRARGLGLGLAIVQRLTDLLGYTLTIDSEVGTGSRFAIEIPYGDAAKVRAPSAKVSSESLNSFDGLPVLVIDDEEEIRFGLKSLLEGWDCRVVTAASTCEALSKIDQGNQQPELILADYRLRDNKTGIEAIADVRRHIDRNVPASIITGDVAPEQLSKFDAAALMVLYKPVSPARLRVLVHQLTKNRT